MAGSDHPARPYQANWKIDLNPLDKAFETPPHQKKLNPPISKRLRPKRTASDLKIERPLEVKQYFFSNPTSTCTKSHHKVAPLSPISIPRRERSTSLNDLGTGCASSFEQISELMPPKVSSPVICYDGFSAYATTACPVQSSEQCSVHNDYNNNSLQ